MPAATELAIDISHITKTIILIKYKDKGALELGIWKKLETRNAGFYLPPWN